MQCNFDMNNKREIKRMKRRRAFVRKLIPLTVSLVLILSIFPGFSSAEQASWDCPGCGRTGNTGNYCGSCAHPAPWLESDNESTLTIETSQRYSQKRYVAAGDSFTIAIADNGTCVATGDAPDVSKWRNIVFICGSRYHVAGIKSDGSVICTNASLQIGK